MLELQKGGSKKCTSYINVSTEGGTALLLLNLVNKVSSILIVLNLIPLEHGTRIHAHSQEP